MAKTIADYSATINPWNAWLTDNYDNSLADFAERFRRHALKAEQNNWGATAWGDVLDSELNARNLNRSEALDAWIAYENFCADLKEYRMANLKVKA